MKGILLIISFFFTFNVWSQLPTFNIQNEESLYKYLKDNNVEFNKADIVTLKDINSFSYYNETDKLTVPEAYFFNRKGFRLKGNFDATSCGQTINNLEKLNKKSFDKTDSIDNWIKEFKFLQPQSSDLYNSGYDGFIIINWAIFLPKMNEASFNWYKSLKDEKKYKIKIILLNLDIQDNWELNQAHKDALHLE